MLSKFYLHFQMLKTKSLGTVKKEMEQNAKPGLKPIRRWMHPKFETRQEEASHFARSSS